MKRYSSLAFAIATACILTGTASMAQDTKGEKGEKGEKGAKGDKNEKLKQYEELIIRKKSDKDGKVVIEIKDGDVIVNGKPMQEFDNDDISIRRSKTVTGVAVSPFRRMQGNGQIAELDYNKDRLKMLGSRAFLGVVTEEAPGGARIVSVSKGTAAEKSGLKEKDIITKIDGEKVKDENDVSRLIRSHKPKDKVKIDILRDGKEKSVTAELGENNNNSQNFGFTMPDNFNLEDLNIEGFQSPRVFEFTPGSPAAPAPYGFNYFGRPKLGIKAQDTEEGKGVKVLDVEHESVAEKSGIKENDIITDFNDKNVNSADELAIEANAAREKSKIPVKLLRDGKPMTLEISIPKKLKTANL